MLHGGLGQRRVRYSGRVRIRRGDRRAPVASRNQAGRLADHTLRSLVSFVSVRCQGYEEGVRVGCGVQQEAACAPGGAQRCSRSSRWAECRGRCRMAGSQYVRLVRTPRHSVGHLRPGGPIRCDQVRRLRSGPVGAEVRAVRAMRRSSPSVSSRGFARSGRGLAGTRAPAGACVLAGGWPSRSEASP